MSSLMSQRSSSLMLQSLEIAMDHDLSLVPLRALHVWKHQSSIPSTFRDSKVNYLSYMTRERFLIITLGFPLFSLCFVTLILNMLHIHAVCLYTKKASGVIESSMVSLWIRNVIGARQEKHLANALPLVDDCRHFTAAFRRHVV